MNHLHQPLLGSLQHVEVGTCVAGISLQPISPAVAARFAAVGGADVVIDEKEAAQRLLAVVNDPVGMLKAHLAVLEALAGRAKRYIDEAERLLPIVDGSEAATIVGMVANIENACPHLPTDVLNDVDFLRDHISEIAFDTKAIAGAINVVEAILAEISERENAIDEAIAQLTNLAEQARAPESLAEARKRRVSQKAARALPGLIVEMEHLRAQTAEALDRIDRALLAVKGVQ
jgi:hypothetical protein